MQSLLWGTGTRGMAVSKLNATGTDSIMLLLIPAGSAESVRKPIDVFDAHRFVPPMLAAAAVDPGTLRVLRIDAQLTDDSPASLKVVERIAFLKMCRENYPDASHFNRDLGSVSLRDFITPAGRAELAVGNERRGLTALRCLQAFGTLGAAVVGQSPAGL